MGKAVSTAFYSDHQRMASHESCRQSSRIMRRMFEPESDGPGSKVMHIAWRQRRQLIIKLLYPQMSARICWSTLPVPRESASAQCHVRSRAERVETGNAELARQRGP